MKKMIYLVFGLLISVGNANALINKETVIAGSKEVVKNALALGVAKHAHDKIPFAKLAEFVLKKINNEPGSKVLKVTEVATCVVLLKLAVAYATYRVVYGAESLLEVKAKDAYQGMLQFLEEMKKKVKSLELKKTLKDVAAKSKAKSAEAYARVRSMIKKAEVVEAAPAA